ncbi:MAG TPA: carboxypeptidase regulatory-like domain-containing protein [Kofleriaceae bacterium]|nr:carboxypeptidase regulatory-like domain-containing protein [Kofleriaceae bacterium]
MGIRGRCIALWLFIMCAFVPATASAQSATTGAIYGVITDAGTGDPLPGVTVVVTSTGSASQTALTDEKGSYKVNDLAPGEYLVTFYYLDAALERPNVPVGVQKVTPLYQKIDTANAMKGEVVQVKGTTPTIDPTSTAQGITIDKNYLQNSPVPGRTFESALGAAAGSQGDIGGVAFSGSTSLENQYYVDGVNTTGLSYGTVGSPVINDFIEEIEIITGGYNAEYGRATGGIVNVVTKSGSNEFKGSIFGYMQPGFLTAEAERTPANATSIDIKGDVAYQTDVGFELGGPIIKDKVWFFIGFAPQLTNIAYTRDVKRQTDCHMVQDDGKLSVCNPMYADSEPDIDPATGFYETDIVDTEVRHSTSQVYNTLAKINYAATPEQQGQLAVQAQPGANRRPNLYGPGGTGTTAKFLGVDVSAKWTAKLNNNKTELEGFIGGHRETYKNQSVDPALQGLPLQILVDGNLGVWGPGFGESLDVNSGCFDDPTGKSDAYPLITNCPMTARAYYIGGPGSLYDDTDQRIAARVGVTQRVKAGGSHEIKGGVDFEDNRTEHTRSLSGGAYVINYLDQQADTVRWVQIGTPETTDPRFDNMCHTPAPPTFPGAQTDFTCDYLSGVPGDDGTMIEGNTFNWATYLRDSWQIRPNLTLNAGLRYEEQRLRLAKFLRNEIDVASGDRLGKNALVLRGELAPRIGLLYDWTKEGRSKAYAHWGRFYESIPMEINDYNFGMPVQYVQTYTPSLCTTMDDPRIGGPDGAACLTTDKKPDLRQELFGVYGSLTAPGVKGQYMDEVVGGIEFEIIDDLKLGVSFQDRRFGRVIEDVSLDNANTYVVSNPGEWSAEEERKFQQRVDAETDETKKQRLMRQLEMFRGIRIFDKPRRNYDALQFTMTRRFSKHLYTQGSYTYSRTFGNYPGLINYDDNVVLPNNSTQYDLIELLANRIGPLPQDRPHYIKLDAYYQFDLKKYGDLTTGIRARALSGTPKSALAPHYLYGDDQSFLVPRGAMGRSSFEHELDIHVGYGRKMHAGKREIHGELFLDIYNVFDNQGQAAIDQSYATIVRRGTGMAGAGGTIQSANPVSGGTYEDLRWVKVIDRNGVESSTPLGRNPNYGNTTARYSPLYARFGARVTF